MRIAVDAMGGDHAPAAAVEGVREALSRNLVAPDTEIRLVGVPSALEPLCRNLPSRVVLEPALEIIRDEESPVAAVRQKPDSSLAVALRLLKQGAADAVVSAGPTGALMAGALLHLGKLPGIQRPALAAVLPTLEGPGVLLLDVGANVDARPEHLLQYAVMGHLYVERVLRWHRSDVALLNIGTEAGKGNSLARTAHQLLSGSSLPFVGNLEARDILSGVAQVVVADGFVGNIALKSLEGMSLTLFGGLREVFSTPVVGPLAGLMLRSPLQALRQRLDYEQYGGAPLFGPQGVVMKCHGSAQPAAIARAVGLAGQFVQEGVLALIESELRNVAG